MRVEALQAPQVVAEQFQKNRELVKDITEQWEKKNPYSLISIARGSSDHAAQYLNFLATVRLGKLTTSLSMSARTLYQAEIVAQQSAAVAISQSGQSPDVVGPIEYFRSQNCMSLAVVNETSSPLAKAAEWVYPLCAGPEQAVAASKSFIASLAAAANLVASWGRSSQLQSALAFLSGDLQQAQRMDWSPALAQLFDVQQMMVVGRGYGLALAQEVALKLKETCGIQAEAFSAAELKHGPQVLIEQGYPVLVLALRGPALTGLLDLAKDLKARGAKVIVAAPAEVKHKDLEIYSSHAEELDVLTAIQSFYLMVEELSRQRGRNPDQPRHLTKITKTN